MGADATSLILFVMIFMVVYYLFFDGCVLLFGRERDDVCEKNLISAPIKFVIIICKEREGRRENDCV